MLGIFLCRARLKDKKEKVFQQPAGATSEALVSNRHKSNAQAPQSLGNPVLALPNHLSIYFATALLFCMKTFDTHGYHMAMQCTCSSH